MRAPTAATWGFGHGPGLAWRSTRSGNASARPLARAPGCRRARQLQQANGGSQRRESSSGAAGHADGASAAEGQARGNEVAIRAIQREAVRDKKADPKTSTTLLERNADSGRGWVRTSDLSRVRRALSR